MAAPVILKDSAGRQITLGVEIGRGGEGAVFDVKEDPGAVAKIYLRPLSRDHVAKLEVMAHLATGALLNLAAWPTGVLIRGAHPAGFLMPKCSGFKPAFELYGPKLRLQQFPKADWRFLIRSAANTARAFSVVHSGGHVIGDVNHGNLVIGSDATVRLIDCDSFQVTDGRRTWFCEVGVATHQPPEMLARASYAGAPRTPNHDAFGLAVLIFQMLCLGRHPFSGRYQGSGDPPPIEDAIRDYRYAYDGDLRTTLMAPPPGSLPMAALTSQIRQMFEAAFLQSGSQGGRPDARQWADVLGDLERRLRQCSIVGSHYYLNSLSACPWCELESKSGATLFPVVFVAGVAGPDGFMVLWQQLEAIRLPEPRKPMPDLPRATPGSEAEEARFMLRTIAAGLGTAVVLSAMLSLVVEVHGNFGVIFAIIAIFGIILLAVRATLRVRFRRRLADTSVEWNNLQKDWAELRRDPTNIRSGLNRVKQDYDAVQADRAAKLRQIHENRRASQLNEYLDRFQITGAKIKGVGPAKAATLQSYSIETAADVVFHAVVAVPGFGPKTAQNLVDWRALLESKFRFDPRRGVPPNEIAVVENAFGVRRRQFEQRLSAGLSDLRTAVAAELSERERLQGKFKAIAPVHAQAVADCRAVALFGGG